MNAVDCLSKMTTMTKIWWHGEQEPYPWCVSTCQNSAIAEVGGGMSCVVVVGIAAVAGGGL